MTPIRLVVLVGSLLGLFVFGLIFFSTASFYIRLIAFFFFFLSFFHAILSAWVSITKRLARASDYIYFLVAALGMLVASFASMQDREEYYAAVASTIGRPDVKQLSSFAETVLRSCDKQLSWPDAIPGKLVLFISGGLRLENSCTLAKQALKVIEEQNYSQVPSLLWRQPITSSIWTLTNPLHPVSAMDNAIYFQLKYQLESLYYYSPDYNATRQTIADDRKLKISAYRYIYSSIWPFILAFAISLRVTRVTADVSEWPL
ncbi:hypothetical protein [Methylocystis sp.]|uniref:hypothetical protein n=1 Tax=Methylocystis sp. TaxID=1911079 RepID=UPI003DA57118